MPLQVIASEQEHKLATTNQEELLQREREAVAYEERAKHTHEAVAVKQRNNEFDIILPEFYRRDDEE